MASEVARKKWRDANPNYGLEWARRRRLDPSFRAAESKRQREWQKAHPVEHSLLQYKNSAKRKGLSLELSRGAMTALILSDCYYCGAAPSPVNGVDRVDNSIGYVVGNTVACCGRCNYAKRDYSLSDFAKWAEQVSARLHVWRPSSNTGVA